MPDCHILSLIFGFLKCLPFRVCLANSSETWLQCFVSVSVSVLLPFFTSFFLLLCAVISAGNMPIMITMIKEREKKKK